MTETELKEFNELKAFKLAHEGKALNRAFGRLDQLLGMAHFNPGMSVRAFRVIADCLISLKEKGEE